MGSKAGSGSQKKEENSRGKSEGNNEVTHYSKLCSIIAKKIADIKHFTLNNKMGK